MTNLSKGSTYSAVVPLTAVVSQNPLTYWLYQIPEPEPEPEPEPVQLMIPINIVFQMSDFRYEIKETSLPVI
jgi:hypothetical protein